MVDVFSGLYIVVIFTHLNFILVTRNVHDLLGGELKVVDTSVHERFPGPHIIHFIIRNIAYFAPFMQRFANNSLTNVSSSKFFLTVIPLL